jgi:hypothetical protein
MLEGSEAAASFINKVIDAKLDGTVIDADVRANLQRNLTERLENQIIHAVLALLDEQEQLELEHLIDSNQLDKVEDYLMSHGVNLNQVLAGVMAEFQASYLGA